MPTAVVDAACQRRWPRRPICNVQSATEMRLNHFVGLTPASHHMESTMKITRKEFLGRMLRGAAGLAGAAVVVACSSSSSGGTDPMNPDAALPPADGGPAPDAAHATS